MVDLKGNPFYLKDEQIAWVNRMLASWMKKWGVLVLPNRHVHGRKGTV